MRYMCYYIPLVCGVVGRWLFAIERTPETRTRGGKSVGIITVEVYAVFSGSHVLACINDKTTMLSRSGSRNFKKKKIEK